MVGRNLTRSPFSFCLGLPALNFEECLKKKFRKWNHSNLPRKKCLKKMLPT
uniref:Uncharacterized protein n=1 Tax=Octopus bimaculoides TaxID=37653 RepID=A0A0L8FQW6_OCTBM